MTHEQLITWLGAEIVAGHPRAEAKISGGYACDMLSFVVSRLQEGQVWLTILNSVNVVAVATLAECSVVLLTESMTMEPPVQKRAAEKGLLVLQTSLSTYEAAIKIDRGLAHFAQHDPD